MTPDDALIIGIGFIIMTALIILYRIRNNIEHKELWKAYYKMSKTKPEPIKDPEEYLPDDVEVEKLDPHKDDYITKIQPEREEEFIRSVYEKKQGTALDEVKNLELSLQRLRKKIEGA